MGSINKVILLGHLGQDPESRMTQGGKQVVTLNLATSESWMANGQREERTEWHRVIAWEKMAETASKYLKKGSEVSIIGKLQTRSWDDANGQKRYTTEILATELILIGGNRTSAPRTQNNTKPQTNTAPAYDDSDVPF